MAYEMTGMHILLALLLSSPAPSPVPVKQKLTLTLPNGWVQTESGRFNEWRSPNDSSEFRVSITAMTPDLQGPNAVDTVKAMVRRATAMTNPAASPDVKTVHVCNGAQVAYRVDDPIGVGSPGFILIVPGSESAGIINYEVLRGKADPRIQSTVDKLCWP